MLSSVASRKLSFSPEVDAAADMSCGEAAAVVYALDLAEREDTREGGA